MARGLDRGVLPTALAASVLDQVLDGMDAASQSRRPSSRPEAENPPDLRSAPERTSGKDSGLRAREKVREASFIDPKSWTVAGVTMGTFGYMSPEQLYGEHVDERTDVYAIGVIALETLTGRMALDGPHFHRTIETELRRRLVDPAVTESQARVARALDRALFPNAAGRFASIAEMRAELIPAILGCPEVPLTTHTVRAAAAPVATAAVTGAPADSESSAPAASPPTRRRRIAPEVESLSNGVGKLRMAVLVTGATGLLGRHLVQALIECRAGVWAVARPARAPACRRRLDR